MNYVFEIQTLYYKDMCPKTEEEIDYMSKVPYSSRVGSLMYAMVCTRPDIAHAVGVVRRYVKNLGKENWMVVKWILKYLRGTTTHELCFGGSNIVLQGNVDSNMASDKDSRRSITRYVFYCGRKSSKLDFKTTEGCFIFISKRRVWCCYRDY